MRIRAPARLGDFDHFREAGDIAVHRIHTFDHDQPFAGGALQLFEVGRLIVAEELHLRLGQDGAIHDARVDVLIQNDPVARAKQAGEQPDVRAVAVGKTMTASFFLKAASSRSSSRCTSIVPLRMGEPAAPSP